MNEDVEFGPVPAEQATTLIRQKNYSGLSQH